MLGRIWRYILAALGWQLDKLEDPEILLAQATQEMKEARAKNRERAVQAITQKNNLQALVDDTQKTVDTLQNKAEYALKRGDRELARQLLIEKTQYETTLASAKTSLQNAIDSSEAIKTALRREEERIRAKTAQALALKAQWKQSQIEISINKAMEGMDLHDGTDDAFNRAQSKISNARSEASARTEIAKTKLESKIADLDDTSSFGEADKQLDDLEIKLGLRKAPTRSESLEIGNDSVEDQLQALELKVKA